MSPTLNLAALQPTTAPTDPAWGAVAHAAAIVLLVLSLVAIVAAVITERRRTRELRDDPLGIARTLDEYRDRQAVRR